MEKIINNQTYTNIITSIVVGAASQVDGVASVSYEPGLVNTVTSKKRGTAVEVIVFENLVTINISVNVYYGKVIPYIICNLQEKIKKEVESATSLKVKTVNVTVVGSVTE